MSSAQRIHATWLNEVITTPDPANHGTDIPGLAGRLFLFGPDGTTLVKVNGKVVVELFDAAELDNKASAKLRWEFNQGPLDALFRKDTIGWGYTLFLPWPQYRPADRRVRLKVSYESGGASLSAPQTEIVLPQEPNYFQSRIVALKKKLPEASSTLGGAKLGTPVPVNDFSPSSPDVTLDVLIAEVKLADDARANGVEVGLQAPLFFSPSISQSGGPGTPCLRSTLHEREAFASGPGVVGFQGITNLGTSRGGGSSPDTDAYVASRETVDTILRLLAIEGRSAILAHKQIKASEGQPVIVKAEPTVLPPNVTLDGLEPKPNDHSHASVFIEIIPSAVRDRQLSMQIKSEIRSSEEVSVRGEIKKIAVDRLKGTLSAAEGQTVIIMGGFHRQTVFTETRMGMLGDLPGIGRVFRWRGKTVYQTGVITLITPHITAATPSSAASH